MSGGTSAGAVLCAADLRHAYGARTVVEIEALEVRAGEVLAVLGPNGAGKSTLFRLLAGVERPDSGHVQCRGRDINRGDADGPRRVAGVFQRPYLFSGTVTSNVAYGLKVRRVARGERTRRAEAALGAVGLAGIGRRRVETLSGGERRRVALARAIATGPELLLLDEPTADLDVTVRRRFREELEGLVRKHAVATLLITHDPADAFALADRIAVMENGRITQIGSPDAIVLEPATAFAAAFAGAELLLDGVVDETRDDLAHVRLPSGATVMVVPAASSRPLSRGMPAHVSYRPEDVVLGSPGDDPVTSARNRFRLRVAALRPAGGLVRVRLEGDVELTALVTRGSAEALGLTSGKDVVARIKATALRVFPAPVD